MTLRAYLLPNWQRRKRMLLIEAWIAIVGAYVLLGLAWLCPNDWTSNSPAFVATWWAAFLVRTLQYHIGLLLLCILIAALVVHRWRMVICTAPIVLAIMLGAWVTVIPRPRPTVSADAPTVRVMSVNLLMINRTTQPIIDEILAADPDVLLVQEYTDHWHAAFRRASILDRYPHAVHVTQDDSFGIALYSRLPFVKPPQVDLDLGDEDVPQIRAVIDPHGRHLAIYNIHLLPPRRLDYTIEHRRQFVDLIEMLRAETHPVILAGDFNFTETTPQHKALHNLGLRDAHDTLGRGRGATWPVNSFLRYLPGLRVDHVYASRDLTFTRFTTGTGEGSDHRPLVAEIAIAGEDSQHP